MQCYQVFKVTDYESQKNRNPKHIHGTCKWFLEHKVYLTWLDREAITLLWVSADPGCGKSVLSRYLVDSRFDGHESFRACLFFFKDDIEAQGNAATALSSLLHQFFSLKPVFLKHAMDAYR